jgi:hypothetical protein
VVTPPRAAEANDPVTIVGALCGGAAGARRALSKEVAPKAPAALAAAPRRSTARRLNSGMSAIMPAGRRLSEKGGNP